MDIIQKQTDIDCDALSNLILKKEPEIIQKYPPTGFDGEYTDGQTELGPNSLTSRFYHFNVLDWNDTDLVKEIIRSGYEAYTGVKDTPIYVKCWANVMRKGDQIKRHKHAKQYEYDEEDYLCGHISVKVDGTTSTYYQSSSDIHPFLNVNGMITLFPCYVYHWTDQYNGNSERITLAFDIKSKKLFDVNVHPDAKWSWVKI